MPSASARQRPAAPAQVRLHLPLQSGIEQTCNAALRIEHSDTAVGKEDPQPTCTFSGGRWSSLPANLPPEPRPAPDSSRISSLAFCSLRLSFFCDVYTCVKELHARVLCCRSSCIKHAPASSSDGRDCRSSKWGPGASQAPSAPRPSLSPQPGLRIARPQNCVQSSMSPQLLQTPDSQARVGQQYPSAER
eukprot:924695-Rhodomonas_salina.1